MSQIEAVFFFSKLDFLLELADELVMSDNYKNSILELSQALIQAQSPIRILDTIKWDESVLQFFLKHKFHKLPKLDRDYYLQRPLNYDPVLKISEFKALRSKINSTLGEDDPVAKILVRNCLEYEDVVRMIVNRGTKEFYKYSRSLFGSVYQLMSDQKTELLELGHTLRDILTRIQNADMGQTYERNIPSAQVVEELKSRLQGYFAGTEIMVKLSDGILSDAAAGSNYIKIKDASLFSQRDIDIFEVHEGWVHLGTTLNGMSQPYAQWLSKGPPCTTATQEGLAVLMEVFQFVTLPERAERINNRLIACEMAENGANIFEVIRFYKDLGQDDLVALKNAQRVFRGGLLEGGAPFTKDISYCKGFVLTYNFLRSAIREGKPEMIPFLFAGKLTVEDIPIIYQLHQEGLVERPKYLPKHFSDLNGIAVWMAFSNFLNKMSMEKISEKLIKSAA